MSEIHVVALIPAKPGSEETLHAALVELVAATRAEEGCLRYDLFDSLAAPGTFVTLETWASQEDLDSHLRSEHIAAALTSTADLVTSPPAIHPLAAL